MNIFDILRDHARRMPNEVATVSPRHRLTTWRKLWSRIERASARLQGEWLVGQADTVVYAGHGHADALVLWLSLARLSARMLALESQAMHAEAARHAERGGAMLLLHDDALALAGLGQEVTVQPLSAIIARPCLYHAQECPEREQDPSLLVAEDGQLGSYSIAQLLDAPAGEWSPQQPLFAPARLQGQILPALVRGLTLELE